MKTIGALAGVMATAVWAFVPQAQPKPVVVQQAAPVQQVQFQAGGLFQTFPGYVPASTIHLQVGGTPMAGSYIAHENMAAGKTPAVMDHGPRRVWTVTLQSNSDPNANGGVYVQRTVNPDGSITWLGGGAFGPIGHGAFSGRVWSPEVTTANMFELSGTDFNCSGGSNFVGNPAWGGGGNLTLTVSP